MAILFFKFSRKKTPKKISKKKRDKIKKSH